MELLSEIAANAEHFSSDLLSKLTAAKSILIADKDKLSISYLGVASIQTWRTHVFQDKHIELQNMLLEAQNDALQSCALSQLGMWRPALQSLRSCLECAVRVAYFQDHPIELEWWLKGDKDFKLSIAKSLEEYFPRHPEILNLPKPPIWPDFVSNLRQEYRELSKAVHASAKSFLMTKSGTIAISTSLPADHGMWFTRHRQTISSINFLLLALNKELLQGTQNRNLRSLLSVILPQSYFPIIKSHLNVVLRSSTT